MKEASKNSNDRNTAETKKGLRRMLTLLTPSANLVTFLAEEMKIAALTERSFVAMSALPSLLVLAQESSRARNAEAQSGILRLLQMAKGDASFAEEEVNSEFQRIRSHHLIAAWSSIETTIEHTLVNHIRRVPNSVDRILAQVPNAKLRNASASTSNAKTAIRAWEGKVDIQETMPRQLEMLRVFDLNVTLRDGSSRVLSELAGLRDVLLHNAGFCDEKFMKRCPWRIVEPGARITINREAMLRYFDAASDFAQGLVSAVVASPHWRIVTD